MRLTVTRKLAISYTVIALTSLTAVVYALTSLHAQNDAITHVFRHDFRALTLTREMRNNVLAQEGLDKQHRIHGDPELLALLAQRQTELESLWRSLLPTARSESVERLQPLLERYLAPSDGDRSALRD